MSNSLSTLSRTPGILAVSLLAILPAANASEVTTKDAHRERILNVSREYLPPDTGFLLYANLRQLREQKAMPHVSPLLKILNDQYGPKQLASTLRKLELNLLKDCDILLCGSHNMSPLSSEYTWIFDGLHDADSLLKTLRKLETEKLLKASSPSSSDGTQNSLRFEFMLRLNGTSNSTGTEVTLTDDTLIIKQLPQTPGHHSIKAPAAPAVQKRLNRLLAQVDATYPIGAQLSGDAWHLSTSGSTAASWFKLQHVSIGVRYDKGLKSEIRCDMPDKQATTIFKPRARGILAELRANMIIEGLTTKEIGILSELLDFSARSVFPTATEVDLRHPEGLISVNSIRTKGTSLHFKSRIAEEGLRQAMARPGRGLLTPSLSDESVNKLYDKLVRSTVIIVCNRNSSISKSGTGCLLDLSGGTVIVTANHVIDRAKTINVLYPIFRNGELVVDPKAYEDQLAASSHTTANLLVKNADTDLAILSPSSVPQDSDPFVLAQTPPTPGDTVHSVGHRSTDMVWIHSQGRVRHRGVQYHAVTTDPSELDQSIVSGTTIITDAPVFPGNSGGPLINNNGELVGISVFTNHYEIRAASGFMDVSELRTLIKTYQLKSKSKGVRQEALIEVSVPAEAQVWLQGKLMSAKGTKRQYRVESLIAGKKYKYLVKASWRRRGRYVDVKQNIDIYGGRTTKVDLTQGAKVSF